ncbi:hypothetical protein H0I76_18635 [Limibaculum sp. M0105]|uniref:Uncharacterized protein n=1 Tax=Thermohalobaculum xanthum TaxID=2753746 RepID=A0A8J7SGV7_9RHOB|nr:hypothetical protein [Thermohalobaculum xanthum]MBK0401221.1 hypothetical protein [Thermohalobaculum xanthum]
MSNVFSDALAPLAARMPKALREIEILRVAAQLNGDDHATSLEAARRAVLAWTKKRAGGPLPRAAWEFQEFDYLAGGRNSSAVRITGNGADIWALRADDPDREVAGRNWTTEVVVGAQPGQRPHVSARLTVSTTESELAFQPAVPGLVLQWIDAPGLIRGGREITSSPTMIGSEGSVEDLCDFLVDPDRRLPVYVVTLPEDTTTPLIDAEAVAKATACIARIFIVPSQLTWVLTRRFGRYRSVFGGAVRAYMPGFNEADDPYRHRLFLSERLKTEDDWRACGTWLRSTAATTSITANRLGREIIDFAFVRTASRKLQVTSLRERRAPDAEQLEVQRLLNESLEKQLNEKEKEIEISVGLAAEAEERAASSEKEFRSLLYRFRALETRLNAIGAEKEPAQPLPSSWDEFLDWIDAEFSDRVLLTPSARRLVKKPDFADVEQVARAVTWLATEARSRLMDGGGSLRDAAIEEGVRNTLCGGDEYNTHWHGQKRLVDWHVKNGGNTRAPERCLRIYYFWEPETQQIVIDHLPSHRVTAAS